MIRTARFLIIPLLFLVMLPQFALGQGRMTPEQMQARFEENFKQLSTTLALTSEQAPRVRAVLQEQQDARMKMMAAMRGGGPPQGGREAMRARMDSLGSDTDSKLAGILNEGQLASYKAFVAEQGARQRGNAPGRRNPSPN